MYEEEKTVKTNYQYGIAPDATETEEDDNFTDVEIPGNDDFENNEPENNGEKQPEEEKKDDISLELQNKDGLNEGIEIGFSSDEENNLKEAVVFEENVEKLEDKQELSEPKIKIINNLLEKITADVEQIKKILPSEVGEIVGEINIAPNIEVQPVESNIVEGVFDGEGMVGSNGKQYDIPANYASKSKLVEGDILKLTITSDGSFLFKQIGPTERNRVVGVLAYDPSQGRYLVMTDNKKWFILTASVTYFKGKPGDESVILIPKNAPSRWAAVENIMAKKVENSNFGGNFNFNR